MTAASVEDAPCFQSLVHERHQRTEFDTDTPIDMIEPMNDSILSVVCVKKRMTAMPANTPGYSADRNEGQIAATGSRRLGETRMTNTATAKPVPRASNMAIMDGSWPISSTRTPLGSLPAASMA